MTTETYIPTPEQIAEACREIQATWTDEERQRRAVGSGVVEWEVPRGPIGE